jgi:murein DD-endopeptidase MepM/ murein hydrolase activator NlpD
VDSLASGTPALWSDSGLCARKIERRIEDAGATIGVGCYDEVRGVYTSDAFRKPGNDGSSWRTVHLGLDLFASPGTAVLAPLDGVVHSLAENDQPLDYGPTVVLEHEAGPSLPGFENRALA